MVLTLSDDCHMDTLRVSTTLVSKVSTTTSDRIRFAYWFEILLTNVKFREAQVLVSGPGSSVGIATELRARRPGIEYR